MQTDDDAQTAATSSSAAVDGEQASKKAKVVISPELENDTALYELKAVVTHKGRDADGGHYVAWCKDEQGWVKFDDDKVSRVTEDEIMKLTGSGGSDWHMAYICLYGAKRMQDHVEQWKREDEKAKK